MIVQTLTQPVHDVENTDIHWTNVPNVDTKIALLSYHIALYAKIVTRHFRKFYTTRPLMTNYNVRT